MRNPWSIRIAGLKTAGVALLVLGFSAVLPTASQDSAFKPARLEDGRPNLNGIWQSLNTANWDLRAHEAHGGPVTALGAAFSEPAGLSVIEEGEIPYQQWALAKKAENAANWVQLDPEIKCYMPGVPRATYMPFPFQIVQSTNTIMIAYEFASASRVIRMNSKEQSPTDSWMGWSIGHWDGDTLVVDVANFNDQTWFDRAGDFHSDALHVVERYAFTSSGVMSYEATIEDPKVFTRPWKISLPLYRRAEKNAQLLEYKCVPFVEELLYGPLRKKAATR